MKIKRKVQKTLPQLIEWLLESGKSEYIVISNMNNIVRLEPYGVIRFSQEKFYPEETFTVEIEEEITEDTVIPKLVSIGRENENELDIRYDCKVSQFLDNEDFNYYVLNDDDTLTLIWRDGKLVE